MYGTTFQIVLWHENTPGSWNISQYFSFLSWCDEIHFGAKWFFYRMYYSFYVNAKNAEKISRAEHSNQISENICEFWYSHSRSDIRMREAGLAGGAVRKSSITASARRDRRRKTKWHRNSRELSEGDYCSCVTLSRSWRRGWHKFHGVRSCCCLGRLGLVLGSWCFWVKAQVETGQWLRWHNGQLYKHAPPAAAQHQKKRSYLQVKQNSLSKNFNNDNSHNEWYLLTCSLFYKT